MLCQRHLSSNEATACPAVVVRSLSKRPTGTRRALCCGMVEHAMGLAVSTQGVLFVGVFANSNVVSECFACTARCCGSCPSRLLPALLLFSVTEKELNLPQSLVRRRTMSSIRSHRSGTRTAMSLGCDRLNPCWRGRCVRAPIFFAASHTAPPARRINRSSSFFSLFASQTCCHNFAS